MPLIYRFHNPCRRHWCARLVRNTTKPIRDVLVIVALVAISEAALAYPDPLTFFNVFAGGPDNGYQSLADSNLGWGQALKPLSDWMRAP